MEKGIIYVMTTVVPGLIKIGKTGSENFEQRMYNLERNGYSNVAGLQRKFAIEVEDYNEKETLLDDIFSKSRVPNTELFALDVDLVIQLLSSFEGRQVYPETKTKEEVFNEATKEVKIKSDFLKIPNGQYFLSQSRKGFGVVEATMRVENGIFIVEKGCNCLPALGTRIPEVRKNAYIVNDILMEDVECNSPSTAGTVVLGTSNNGWVTWKNKVGDSIDIYRKER